MNLAAAIRALTGQEILFKARLHGGDLSEVFRLTLAGDGNTCIAKTGPLVAREARMLSALGKAGAPVPNVIGLEGELLLLEDLPDGPTTPAMWDDFGTALRLLHNQTGQFYGWDEDYAFGPVAIPNTPSDSWPGFWAERRLMAAPEALPSEIAHRIEALAARLPDLLPAHPPAALLHGDLWHGNIHLSQGRTWLIDPACYYGDPEVDLAMLHLFGAPDPRVTRRYGTLPPDHEKRRPLYQLWPALVHLRLFGAGYRGMVTDLLDRLGA